jgi:hypothetical protein
MTIIGQSWAREDTKESNHEAFQAIWKLLDRYTEESPANLQQTWPYFRDTFAFGPPWHDPNFYFIYLQDGGPANIYFLFLIICRTMFMLGEIRIELFVV